jgi:hypothetical protein
MTDANNVGENRPKGDGRFVKGDPRCWRNGRPKSFDKLRKLAQQIADESATSGDKPIIVGAQVVIQAGEQIIIGGHVATQAEMLLREMLQRNPEKFTEIAYGKVPTPIEMTVKDDDIDAAIAKELARVAAASQAKDAGAAAIEKPVV